MTIPNAVNVVQYTGPQSSPLSLPFLVVQQADVVVYLQSAAGVTPVKLTLNTDYTVALLNQLAGAQLLFVSTGAIGASLATGAVLTVSRDPAEVQTTAFQAQGPFPAPSVQNAIDLLTMEVQSVRTRTNNSLQVPLVESLSAASLTLPLASARASQYLGFDASGNAIVIAPNNASGTAVTSTGSTTPRLLADRFADIHNVLDFGAVGDGVTDDKAAIQLAINYQNAHGGAIWLPALTFALSGPLTMYNNSVLLGVPSVEYINFSTDYQQANPSYYQRASILQMQSAVHAAFFAFNGSSGSVANGCVIQGITFRVGKASTSADVWTANVPSHCQVDSCKFENLWSIINNTGTSFGAGVWTRNRFFANATCFNGVFVDSIFSGNIFTSNSTVCMDFTSGAGLVTVVGNRFEYNTATIILAASRPVVITGNLFDYTTGPAIDLRAQVGATITGNLFWRNGSGNVATQLAHIRIYSTCSGIAITGNQFLQDTPDGGGTAVPQSILEFESAPEANVLFRGNSTVNGYTTAPVNDRFGTSDHALDADLIEIGSQPLSGTPNTSSDTIATMLHNLHLVLSGQCKVTINQARQLNASSVAYRCYVAAIAASAVTLATNSQSLQLGRADNLIIGSLTYTDLGGRTISSGTPSTTYANGRWVTGTILWATTPTSGQPVAWGLTDTGSVMTVLPFANL